MNHSQIAQLCHDHIADRSDLQRLAVQTDLPVGTLQAIFAADDVNLKPHEELGPWWNTVTRSEAPAILDVDASKWR